MTFQFPDRVDNREPYEPADPIKKAYDALIACNYGEAEEILGSALDAQQADVLTEAMEEQA